VKRSRAGQTVILPLATCAWNPKARPLSLRTCACVSCL